MEIWEETIDLPNELATGELARQIASVAGQSDVIALVGALGAGKTTFSRAFIHSIYARFELPPPDVQSPTFGLVHRYDPNGLLIHHFDFYRLEDESDLQELGLEEAIQNGISLIEWPAIAMDSLPPETLILQLEATGGALGPASRRAVLKGVLTWRDRLNGVTTIPQPNAEHSRASDPDQ